MPADNTKEKDKDVTSSASEPIEGEVVKAAGQDQFKSANPLNDATNIKQSRSRSRVFIYVVLGFLVFIYVAGTILTTVLSHATNSWTGKGNNDDWSNVRNWSLGLPLNGQTLVFNLSKINLNHYTLVNATGVPGSINGNNVALYDNIKNLVVKKIVLTGNNPNFNNHSKVAPANIGGDALGVTDQIVNDTARNNVVSFYNQLNLSKNVLINSLPQNSAIYFDGTVNMGTATVHLQTNQAYTNNQLVFSGPLTGSGAIFVNQFSDVSFPGDQSAI